MRYALNLNEGKRILSVTFDKYAPENQPRVETLPEGNVSDYKFENGKYVYDPLPVPEEPEPGPTLEQRVEQTEADIAFIAMMSDIEL